MSADVRKGTWRSSASNAYGKALASVIGGVGAIGALVALLIPGSGATGAWLALACAAAGASGALLALGIQEIHVSIDEVGVKVSYGPWMWPTVTHPWSAIEQVSACKVLPARAYWPHTSATRIGEGLRVEFAQRSELTIACEDSLEGQKHARRHLRKRHATRAGG